MTVYLARQGAREFARSLDEDNADVYETARGGGVDFYAVLW